MWLDKSLCNFCQILHWHIMNFWYYRVKGNSIKQYQYLLLICWLGLIHACIFVLVTVISVWEIRIYFEIEACILLISYLHILQYDNNATICTAISTLINVSKYTPTEWFMFALWNMNHFQETFRFCDIVLWIKFF